MSFEIVKRKGPGIYYRFGETWGGVNYEEYPSLLKKRRERIAYKGMV